VPTGENASIAEVVWAISSAVGLLVFVGLTWQAWRDYNALIRLGQNGGRKIAAWTAIGIQGGLAATQAIAVAIGVLRGVLPPQVPLKPVTTTETLITLGLIMSEVVLVSVGVLTHVGRVRLLSYLEGVRESEDAARHAETMAELVHNTEVTTEARDGAQEAYHAANNINSKILDVKQEIAETNRVTDQVAQQLHEYMQQIEGERKEGEE